jgi:ABC-type branched-subunit amino acid transport system permease subunit
LWHWCSVAFSGLAGGIFAYYRIPLFQPSFTPQWTFEPLVAASVGEQEPFWAGDRIGLLIILTELFALTLGKPISSSLGLFSSLWFFFPGGLTGFRRIRKSIFGWSSSTYIQGDGTAENRFDTGSMALYEISPKRQGIR